MPREELKDVKPPEVTSPQEDIVDESAPDVQIPEPPVEGQEARPASPAQEVKEESIVADDRPIQNVAWEAKRKSDEALAALQRIESALQQRQQEPEKPQFSKAQLKVWAEAPESTPQQKVWALEEIDKIEKTERQEEMRKLFESHTKQSQETQERQQALQFVTQSFPEIVYKDDTGNFAGFNQSHPMYQKIDMYMRNPDLARNPSGLIVAAKMAAFDLGVSMNRKLQNKVSSTTAQLRKEQKKNLISSPGTQVADTGKSKIAKLAAEYQRTGDKNVFRELAKARGLIPVE